MMDTYRLQQQLRRWFLEQGADGTSSDGLDEACRALAEMAMETDPHVGLQRLIKAATAPT